MVVKILRPNKQAYPPNTVKYKKEVLRKLKSIEVKEKKIRKQLGTIESDFQGSVNEEKSINYWRI